jgi:PAS domain S-box-containing protein
LVEDGKFIEVNPAACRLYGRPRDALLSKHPGDLSPEYQPNNVRSSDLANEYMRAAIRGEPQHFKWQHLRNGVPFTADISLNAARYLRIPGQESQPRFVTILRDVTEKEKVAQSLTESELRFRQLFDFAPVAMCLWDEAGQVVDVNRSWLEILGYSIEDMQQQAQWWQKVFPDTAYAAYVKQDWRDMFASLVASENQSEAARELAHEVLVNCADGRQRYLIVMPAIVGQYTVLSLYDMTEQRAANMKLKQLNAHLEERVQERTRQLQNALDSLKSAQNELVRSEKLAGLGALVAGVSHELNTPIGNAVIMSDTLSSLSKSFVDEISKGLRKSTLDKFIYNMEQAVQIINRNLHKASELILSFKQVAVDQSSYQRRSFLINDVFHELTLMLTPTLKKKGVTLIEHAEGRVLMDSYPGPLTQVLINLVNNAVVHAFTEQSSEISPQIEVNATLIAKDEVEISVADNGFGMDEVIVDKIFDPFFTTKLGKGGSGLGLHICYTLVNDLLSGSIKVESIQGKGTVFRLRLPLTAPNVTVNE